MQNQVQMTNRVKEERVAADVAAYGGLTKFQISRWERCKSAHRFMAYKSKELVAYKLVKGKPEVITTLRNISAFLSPDCGLTSRWEDEEGNQIVLDNTPQEVALGCFMWHPKHNTLELVDWRGGKSLRFSTMWRTAVNPSKKVDGEIYLSEKLTFDRNF